MTDQLGLHGPIEPNDPADVAAATRVCIDQAIDKADLASLLNMLNLPDPEVTP